MSRLGSLQPQLDLLETRLKELKKEKEGEEDPSAFLDADINALSEHYQNVLDDLRARERQLQLGERREMLNHCKNLIPATRVIFQNIALISINLDIRLIVYDITQT